MLYSETGIYENEGMYIEVKEEEKGTWKVGKIRVDIENGSCIENENLIVRGSAQSVFMAGRLQRDPNEGRTEEP